MQRVMTMWRVMLLLLVVFATTIGLNSNAVAATGIEQVTSNQACTMNEYPANDKEVEEGSDKEDCD